MEMKFIITSKTSDSRRNTNRGDMTRMRSSFVFFFVFFRFEIKTASSHNHYFLLESGNLD